MDDVTRAKSQSASWRQLVIIRAARDRAELAAAGAAGDPRAGHIEELLSCAEWAAGRRPALRRWWSGSSQDLAWISLHEAEAQLTGLLSAGELTAHAKDLLAKARTASMVDDERVQEITAALKSSPACPLDSAAIMHLARAVYGAWDERYAQSRGFRNRLIRLTLISLAALALLMVAFATNLIPLPSGAVPSFVEIAALVSLFGAVGALVTAVPPLANAAGTWNPFSLPLYQLLLKLVLGPVFAIVGVMLLQSKVVPNVQFPRRLPDLLVWSVVFGAAQQAVTRVIDRRAEALVSTGPDAGQKGPDRSAAGTSR
jgi:hypothetical protein